MTRKYWTRWVLSLVGFTIGVVGVMGLSVAAAPSGDDSPAPVVTPDKEQAERDAGYVIVTPGNLPAGMALQAYIVDGNKTDNKADSVDQYWHISTEGSAQQWISVMQGPRTAGLLNSAPATIHGVEGQRVRYESEGSREHPIVEMMWPHEDGFLYVSGNIVGTQTEDTLLAVAASLIP